MFIIGVGLFCLLGVWFKLVLVVVSANFLFMSCTCAVRLVMWFMSWFKMALSMVLLLLVAFCVG